jgi:protoporphyrinogen oxidase
VLTTSCRHIEALCPQLRDTERERLQRVEYLGVQCVSVVLDRPLGPYYVTNITDDSAPFTAVIEMSALVAGEALGARGLVYLPQYLAHDDPRWSDGDEQIVERALRGLERLYPGARATVQATRVARARDVMALPTLHYSRDAMPSPTTSIPGVFIANSSQIGAGTLNVNETLGVADAAERTLEVAGIL